MSTIKIYRSMSGYKLNIQKSDTMSLGDPVQSTVKKEVWLEMGPRENQIPQHYYPQEHGTFIKLNGGDLQSQIKDMTWWKIRPLTLAGKIDVIR